VQQRQGLGSGNAVILNASADSDGGSVACLVMLCATQRNVQDDSYLGLQHERDARAYIDGYFPLLAADVP
jgi:hypothetical protein